MHALTHLGATCSQTCTPTSEISSVTVTDFVNFDVMVCLGA